ncbi:DUF2023 family protein [Saccharicrinis fermentans]|uniref:DUF2023 domain-containing protein n=1 Tax=Saccharicrinis fermentans DSM 9555 = JCM 21142 TaxID=869213 RepID=W7Y2V8_9BACT|nr:DUF2023 family protein [Saccharicrinis fermentans]GAF01913.1 hypothetical protein JCM21142_535 [Saccharicrinis fermentans DSM 9555 = JCM 21142]
MNRSTSLKLGIDNSDRMRVTCAEYKSAEMQILMHHVYEYKKGLRNLVLHTMHMKEQYKTEELLKRRGISFITQALSSSKINVFFGDSKCVSIIKSFGNKNLNEFSDEEDFILGTMLGYDRMQQCERFLKRKELQSKALFCHMNSTKSHS